MEAVVIAASITGICSIFAAIAARRSSKYARKSWEHICGPDHPDRHDHPHENIYDMMREMREDVRTLSGHFVEHLADHAAPAGRVRAAHNRRD